MHPELGQKLKRQFPFVRPFDGFRCDDGWYDVLERLFAKMAKLPLPQEFAITTIKEKFGELRVYVDDSSVRQSLFDEIGSLVADAAEESTHICEVCGRPGSRRMLSRVKTLCDEHYVQAG